MTISSEDKYFGIEAVNRWRNDSPEQIRIRQLEAALIEIEDLVILRVMLVDILVQILQRKL